MASKLSVLVLPESPYPPTCGNALRDVQQVALLRRLGYDVALLCVRPRCESSAAADREAAVRSGVRIEFVADEAHDRCETWWDRVRRKLGYVQSRNAQHPFAWWSIPYSLPTTLPAHIAAMKPAAVIVRSLFVDHLPALRRVFVGTIVVDCHDDDVHLAGEMIRSVPWWRAVGPWVNYRGVLAAYRKHMPLADEIWAVSLVDAARLRTFADATTVVVVPSAVDENEIAATAVPGRDDVCALVANYGYGPNLNGARWLTTHVWPRVRRVRPAARLLLVGGGAGDAIAKLVAGRPAITVTGRVDDLRPIYAEAGVMLAPLHQGGGSRLKIVEAWKHGKAVLTTSKGIEGIAAPPHAAAVHDDAEDFATALVRLMANGSERRRLAEAGRTFVSERLSFRRVASDLVSQSVLSLSMSERSRASA